MTLRNRVDRLASMAGAGLPEVVRVAPEDWDGMSPAELEAHRAHVRRVAMNPRGLLVCVRRVSPSGIPGCLQYAPDPLTELLGPDDPAVTRHRGPGVTIARSYGVTG